MSSVEIRRVADKKDLKAFIEFHYELYEGNPYDAFIAYNEDEGRPNDEVLSQVKKVFAKKVCPSFNVGTNPPFIKNVAGTISCPSFTMALNRNLYMNEKERTIIQSSYKLSSFFNELYRSILAINSFE